MMGGHVATCCIILASLAVPVPTSGAVAEGDPLVWFLDDGPASRCTIYGLRAEAENITGYGTCGSGFAIAAGGTSIAPPHVFEGFGLNRTVDVGTSGRAHLVFSEILNPGVYEVQTTVRVDGAPVLIGRGLCDISAPCDMDLAGEGGSGRFEDVVVQVDFPTIVGAVTPSITYGGPDPSRIEATGAWGVDYVVHDAIDRIAPLANLTSDGILYLGQGTSQRCLAMSQTRLQGAFCLVGNEQVVGNHILGEHWVAPRGLNISGGAILRIGLAPYLTDAEPAPGTMALDVTLIAMGRPALHGRADCAWDQLPSTCEVQLEGGNFSIPWKGSTFLDITATTESPAVRLAAGADPGSLAFTTWTWDPDPVPQQTSSEPAPALGVPLLVGILLLLGARRR